MSIWDDLQKLGENAIKDAMPDVQSHVTDWITKTVTGNTTVPQSPVPAAPQTPAPIQVVATQAANFAQNNMMYLILAGVGLVSFLLFRRGR